VAEGATGDEARSTIWLVDRRGLVHAGRSDLDASKRAYAQPTARLAGWGAVRPEGMALADVARRVRPTVLIGAAAQPGAFTEAIVRELARHAPRPIIFPLSNPTALSEAAPADLLAWTGGRALVATGSPFPPVSDGGRTIRIGQCNNAYIFPGVGLGVIAAGARRVSDAMFVAAARALSAGSPARRDPDDALYPPVEELRAVARRVASAVGLQAQRDGAADEVAPDELERRIAAAMWTPRYPRLVHAPQDGEVGARRRARRPRRGRPPCESPRW
jgi:malate dehydrogenase (oxaloacetate-decarboxylating)